MKTRSERFVEERRERWNNLRQILLLIRRRSFEDLTREQVMEFPRLYRLLCSDLAEARMLKLSPDVQDYLNNLVAQAHRFLYSFPPVEKGKAGAFFRKTLPGVLGKYRQFVLTSAILFFGSFFITFVVTMNTPSLARLIMPGSVLEQMESSYESSIGRDGGVGTGAFAASFYIQHNITIAFFSFASGVLLGLGTVYFLVYNGIALGAVAGYINALGYGANFWNFVTAHSVMELSGLVVAGAAGLFMGYSILRARRYYRTDWLRIVKGEILTLLLPAIIMLAIAALIEGNISPSRLPYPVKAGTAIVSACAIIIYFVYLPIAQKRRGGENDGERDE